MPEPRFLTQWEREDYEREKRGEAPLGPFGRKGANAPEPTQEQIDAAAKAMFEAEQLARRGATEGDCRVLARIALAAAAALSPEKARDPLDDIQRKYEEWAEAAFAPEKRREE